MFSVGFSELILILIIAYVFVGPEDLPNVARCLGRVVKRIRSLIIELKEETGLEEVIKETKEMRKDIDSAIKDNDIVRNLREVQGELNDVNKKIIRSIDEAKADTFKK